jgi:hypothetical protein
MTSNLPARREDEELAVGTELHADHRDPQLQAVQQDLRVALIPLALILFLSISFVVAAWTFLAAG